MPLHGNLEAQSIYISLNSRPNPGEYHWGLILTDSLKTPMLHHASNSIGPWLYQHKDAKPENSKTLIVLVHIDKVKSHSRTTAVMKGIPAEGGSSQRTGEPFTCRTWVKDALVALHDDGEISLQIDIDKVEAKAVALGLRFAKKAEDGRGATVVDLSN